MKLNGWEIYYFRIFKGLLDALEKEVISIKKKDPTKYRSHPTTKLLKDLLICMLKDIPSDPNSPRFSLGKTIGRKYTHWRRAKKLLPSRYRFFFRFSSKEQAIIYVWFNDDNCLRNEGARSDVYRVFKCFLKSGKIPDTIEELLEDSEKAAPPEDLLSS